MTSSWRLKMAMTHRLGPWETVCLADSVSASIARAMLKDAPGSAS